MALYLVSTPIGNLADITIRALQILFTAPVILAEDTRRTGNLLEHYRKQPQLLKEILSPALTKPQSEANNSGQRWSIVSGQLSLMSPQFVSFHEHNEHARIEEVIAMLKADTDAALVSDAGTPLISDPGFKLVRRCLKEKIQVISIPGYPLNTVLNLT